MKKNIPFIITMSLFMLACAAVTVFAVRNEPQYVRIIPGESSAVVSQANLEKINVNTANSEELQSLSGIGETIALRIMAYREEHDGFSDIEEIMEVSGIGESIFENIKDYITVE